ncbi:MAG TPA: HAMP domain-containing protein [Candidatus Edwardsbacteria bacterium]|nr:HAMP domain-containing protein [Candidatus Edwardsbacteria bacterium]
MSGPLRSSIRGKLVILVAVVITLSAVLTALVVPRLVSQDILDMMEQRDMLLLRDLASRCEQVIVSERPQRLAAQLAADPVLAAVMASRMAQQSYYLRLAVADASGRVVFSRGRDDIPLALYSARHAFEDRRDEFIIAQDFGPQRIYQLGSIVNHQQRYLGCVILVASEAQARGEFTSLWAVIILIFTIISVVGMAASMLLSLRMTAPLERLSEAIHRVMEGDLEARLDVKSGDEIEQLGAGFNRMLVSLKEARQRDLSANPLTGLPGNSIIEQRIGALIAQGATFAVLYVDLDHFKEFNDHYGFVRGDEVLRFTAMMLAEALHQLAGAGGFLGHVGGDDFVMICDYEASQPLANAVTKGFSAAIDQYYDLADRRAGYIEVADRAGHLRRYGLMTVSVAVVTNKFTPIRHIGQFSQIAAQLKKQAKQRKRDKIAFDRRHES